MLDPIGFNCKNGQPGKMQDYAFSSMKSNLFISMFSIIALVWIVFNMMDIDVILPVITIIWKEKSKLKSNIDEDDPTIHLCLLGWDKRGNY